MQPGSGFGVRRDALDGVVVLRSTCTGIAHVLPVVSIVLVYGPCTWQVIFCVRCTVVRVLPVVDYSTTVVDCSVLSEHKWKGTRSDGQLPMTRQSSQSEMF